MGIIKREKVEDKGVLHLKGEEAELKPEELIEVPEIELGPEEYPALERVEEKAREIIEQARQESERIKQAVRAEGIEEGKKEGLAQVADQVHEAAETLNQAVKGRKKIIKDAE